MFFTNAGSGVGGVRFPSERLFRLAQAGSIDDRFCYACVKGRSEVQGHLTARAVCSHPDAVAIHFSLGSEKCERFTGFPCRAGSHHCSDKLKERFHLSLGRVFAID